MVWRRGTMNVLQPSHRDKFVYLFGRVIPALSLG